MVRGTTQTRYRPRQHDREADWEPEPIEAWDLPEVITPEAIADARALLDQWNAFMAPARIGKIGQPGTRAEWLSQLAAICILPAAMTTAAAMQKLVVYVIGLEYPAICFTPATLYQAGRKFKFLPSFGEVDGFLAGIAKPLRTMHERIRIVAEAQPRLGPPPEPVVKRFADMTEEERARHEDSMRALRANLKAEGIGMATSHAAVQARARATAATERMRERIAPEIEAERARFMGEDQSP